MPRSCEGSVCSVRTAAPLLLVCLACALQLSEAGTEKIKVIGAGLGRTGTESLRIALDTLGYRTYHHAASTDARHHALWEKVYASRGACAKSASEAIAAIGEEGYNATSGYPASLVYKEILARYPDALVVLGVLGSEEEFAEAYADTLGPLLGYLTRPPFKTIVPWVTDFLDYLTARAKIEHTSDYFPVSASLPGAYRAWVEEVKASVPADQLLVHNAKEGWAPLCAFLGKHLHRGASVGHTACPVTDYPAEDAGGRFSWPFLLRFAEATTYHWPYVLYALIATLSLLTFGTYALCAGLFRPREGKRKAE